MKYKHVILYTHGSSRGMFVGGSGRQRISMYQDPGAPGFWFGSTELNIFSDGINMMCPERVNFMACNQMNHEQGARLKTEMQKRINGTVYFSRGVFIHDQQNYPPPGRMFLIPGDNPDPSKPPSTNY